MTLPIGCLKAPTRDQRQLAHRQRAHRQRWITPPIRFTVQPTSDLLKHWITIPTRFKVHLRPLRLRSQLTNSLANSNSTATGIPPPLNYSTHPSRVTHQHNPYQVPVTGWEEYDLVDIAGREYYYALRQLSCLRNRAANLPKGSFYVPDPTVELAELELKNAASVLERMIDFKLQQTIQDEPIAPGPAPPSPTYSEFSDIPPFTETTPAEQTSANTSRDEEL